MELDYFKMRLQSYLREHGFDPEDITDGFIDGRADTANTTFEQSRRAGYSVDESVELAVQDLFTGVGDSPREALAEILLNEFHDRINVTDQLFLEFWIGKLRDRVTVMPEFKMEDGIGLDPRALEESRGTLIHRIDQYLKLNGL